MKDLEISEKIIFLLTIAFALFLHFHNLNQLSGWTDEFASMYFAENLSTVYSTETHPPLFYAVLKPFMWIFGKNLHALRMCVSLMSLGLIVLAANVAKNLFGWRGAILISVLLVFNPVEIIHSRMVRQYSIFFELTVLLILYSMYEKKELVIMFIGLCLSWIHPLGFLPVVTLIALDIFTNRKLTRRVWLLILSIAPIFIYYGSKLLFLGSSKFLTGYNTGSRNYNFYLSILQNLSGEHFPKVNFYPPSVEFKILVAVTLIGLIIYGLRKPISKTWWMILSFLFVTFISAEFISIVLVNIKFGRYYTYLFAPFIVFAVDKFHGRKMAIPVGFVIGLISLNYVNPFVFYPGERELINQVGQESSALLCANEFQFYYHFNFPEIECREQYKTLRDEKVDFYFVDLSGFGIDFIGEINSHYDIREFRRIGNMSFARAYYRKESKL